MSPLVIKHLLQHQRSAAAFEFSIAGTLALYTLILVRSTHSDSTKMEWSKELTTHLIELFREHRVLWDPTFMDFKNRNKKHDAWTELGAELKTDSSEVEKKMRKLIGQFQRELKKGKSGDGADATYKTKWIFFKMLLFLKDKNEPRHSTEGGLSPEEDTQDTSDNKTAQVSTQHFKIYSRTSL